jgi:hypothetical protein
MGMSRNATGDPEYISLATAWHRVGISGRSLRRLIAEEKLRGYRLTWKLLIDVEELDAIIRRAATVTANEETPCN